MADSKPKAKEKKTVLPWGMSGEVLKPTSVKVRVDMGSTEECDRG